MKKAYLTIDDSPSARTDDLVDFLTEHNLPAVLYVRGDRIAEYSDAALVRAVENGIVLGNHLDSHRRSSQLSYDEIIAEIVHVESLIDDIYRKAGKERPCKLLRFPHMDRGCGGWVVNYDAASEHRETLLRIFADGLNIDLSPPSEEDLLKKQKLQEYLHSEGFSAPFKDMIFPWYAGTEMAEAIDAMYTFSTSDWMVTERHCGKWPYKSLEDLKQKIDDDLWLQSEESAHIILAHDEAEIHDVTLALIGYMMNKGFEFISV